MNTIYFTFWQEQAVNVIKPPSALANLMVMCVWARGILWYCRKMEAKEYCTISLLFYISTTSAQLGGKNPVKSTY